MDAEALGFKLKLEYQGLVVESVSEKSPAAGCGLKKDDLLVKVGRDATRYMPTGKVLDLIRQTGREPVSLTVRRNVMMTRK